MNTLNWAAAVAIVLALWAVDHYRQEKNAAIETAGRFSDDLQKITGHYNDLAREMEKWTELADQVAEITKGTKRLSLTIDSQTSLLSRNFAELKRNDQAVAGYLGISVPAALGVRYARPETTDPAAYRAAATGMQPGAVPSSGAAAAGDH